MKKCKVGDIYALPTKKGFALMQVVYVGSNKNDLDIIRVIDGFIDDATKDVSEMINNDTLYFLRFPIRFNSVRSEFFEFCGNFIVPLNVSVPTTFRHVMKDRNGNRIWTKEIPGVSRTIVTKMDREFLSLSPYTGFSILDIKEMLENSWRLSDWK